MYAVEFSPSKSRPICDSKVNAGVTQIILPPSVLVPTSVNMLLVYYDASSTDNR